MTTWAGIDVGGRKKGFHGAVVDRAGIVAGPARLASAAETADWLLPHLPAVVAVDSPRRPAEDGSASRACERRLAREVCGLRFTPDRGGLNSNAYYEWILNGFELYDALETGPWEVVECFPTASWSRWAGPREGTRAAWSRRALDRLKLGGIPNRLSQDGRDAIAAAVTARLYAAAETERYGEIVVPRAA
jgi:predicted nuclease with RNAse H fold